MRRRLGKRYAAQGAGSQTRRRDRYVHDPAAHGCPFPTRGPKREPMSDPTSRPWRETGEGVSLTVRLTPRGGRDALDGVETLADGRFVLKARVRAAPTEGEANAALILLLSGELRLPRSQIAIVAGASARLKTVLLRGEPRALVSALETRIHGGR